MKTLNNIKKIWGAALIGIASFMLQGCQEAAQKGDGLLMTGTSSDRLPLMDFHLRMLFL